MARRIVRRRRPATKRVVRRVARPSAGAASSAPQAPAPPTKPTGSPVLMATTATMRNQIFPKLAEMDGIVLAGLAESPEAALKMLVQEHPEVVLMDIDFGGTRMGLDTAKMMQSTRTRAAVVMMVPELNAEEQRMHARQFGASWSYIKKTTDTRVDILEMVLKSALRGVQWIEPALSRELSVIWKIAEEA